MNKKIVAILFASGNESKLNELTIHRTTASLPFAGRYRLIDFTLSSLVNSGVTRIGIITRNNYSSLMDHIRMGRDWDLNRKNSGIAVFPPFVLNTSREVYKGKIEALYTVLDFLKKAPEDYVCVSNCNIAANIDFDAILEEHIARGADCTMLCHKACVNRKTRFPQYLYSQKRSSHQPRRTGLFPRIRGFREGRSFQRSCRRQDIRSRARGLRRNRGRRKDLL